MSTQLCLDCDSHGDGNCPVCHGVGMLPGDTAGSYDDLGDGVSCSSCSGSGECSKCDGTGQIEVGGEG
jgi:hypothetical protein